MSHPPLSLFFSSSPTIHLSLCPPVFPSQPTRAYDPSSSLDLSQPLSTCPSTNIALYDNKAFIISPPLFPNILMPYFLRCVTLLKLAAKKKTKHKIENRALPGSPHLQLQALIFVSFYMPKCSAYSFIPERYKGEHILHILLIIDSDFEALTTKYSVTLLSTMPTIGLTQGTDSNTFGPLKRLIFHYILRTNTMATE